MSCSGTSDSVFVKRSEQNDILADINALMGGAKKRRGSKKASKKSSRRSSKKQRGGELVLDGGAKKRRSSKKASKKSSKRRSKKQSGGDLVMDGGAKKRRGSKKGSRKGSKKQSGGREMNPKFKAAQEIAKVLREELKANKVGSVMKLSFKLLGENSDSSSKAISYIKSNKSSVEKQYNDLVKESDKKKAAKKSARTKAMSDSESD